MLSGDVSDDDDDEDDVLSPKRNKTRKLLGLITFAHASDKWITWEFIFLKPFLLTLFLPVDVIVFVVLFRCRVVHILCAFFSFLYKICCVIFSTRKFGPLLTTCKCILNKKSRCYSFLLLSQFNWCFFRNQRNVMMLMEYNCFHLSFFSFFFWQKKRNFVTKYLRMTSAQSVGSHGFFFYVEILFSFSFFFAAICKKPRKGRQTFKQATLLSK